MGNTDVRLRNRVAALFALIVLLTLVGAFLALRGVKSSREDEFTRLTNVGKNYLDKGEAPKAVEAFSQALKLNPTHPDAQLNLANACLRNNQPDVAAQHAQEVLNLDASHAAAHYVIGCADLRLGKFEDAIKSLQQAKDIDRTVNAVSFQLGRAFQSAGLLEDARAQFEEVIKFEPDHPAAHYNLSQVLVRLGKIEEANQELAAHQKILAGKGPITDPSVYERCQYTEARLPFRLEQPEPRGIKVAFADATVAALGESARTYHGPAGVIDFAHDGRNSLFVGEGDGFRLLVNSNGTFRPFGNLFTNLPGAKYRACLVGDLNNDEVDDLVMLSEQGTQVFKLTTNGTATDISQFCRLRDVGASGGALVDVDFTGKLGLLAIAPAEQRLRFLSNLGSATQRETPAYFMDKTTNAGLPLEWSGVRQVLVEDWNNDDLLDLFVAREGQPPRLLTRIRGGPFTDTNQPPNWPAGSAIAVGDLNNDFRPDLLVAAGDQLVCVFNGLKEQLTVPLGKWPVSTLNLVDYDNDGWLDIVATGPGLRAWRNLGPSGFRETTQTLGLDKLPKGRVVSLAAADFDGDCDTDWLLTLEGQSLQLLRNEGGNANHQLKVHLVGNRSNASGLGIRLEVTAGGLRLTRRVAALPVEMGVGQHAQLDSLTARWFSLSLNNVDVKVVPCSVMTLTELFIRDGSCPFLYAWDGKGFRFVTDILGASPAGLRLSPKRLIDADPEEYVWLGSDAMFPPRHESYVLQITEELREVLYLDAAKLVVVDHPLSTEVHTTGKLLPAKPFPKSELVTLHRRRPLRRAVNHEGADVTAALMETDGNLVSPTKLRMPQLCGLAEPHNLTLDFDPLPTDRPLVLALTGWLRFGGATVNMAAAEDPDLPFPFPALEVEIGSNQWRSVDVVVGAPAGKTKSIVVDLSGKLPSGSGRLRLSTAFELHWDRIALFEKRDHAETRVTALSHARADLHWRGFSVYRDLPWYLPHSPDYEQVRDVPPWRITPAGWCTRYGEVGELVAAKDNGLALLNGGDELTLEFAADRLPAKPPGMQRDFFLFSVGWDKDADFHNARGTEVEPIPWHGMDDQLYGQQPRPTFSNDAWMKKYNTRWVGPYTVARAKR